GRGLSHAAAGRPRKGRARHDRALVAIRRAGGLFADPDLFTADEGDAAGHAQLAGIDQLQLGLVGLALGRVEDGAAGPLVAIAGKVPEDGQALDRLVLVGALALVAGRVRAAVGLGDLDHLAAQLAARLGDLDDRLHPAGFVVDGFPAPFRRRLRE